MRVLVACEFSGIAREAFKDKGHDAWSCDLLPTERPGQHIQADVLSIIDDGWDLMIAHPPCTYLTNAGIGYFNIERYGQKAIDRWYKRIEAFEFFIKLTNAPIKKICIENPVGFVNTAYRKPNQIIHPYYFGDGDMKRTCLWLKNLSNLEYRLQDDLFGVRTATDKPKALYTHERKPSKHYNGGEVKKRYFTDAKQLVNGNKIVAGHERSRTFLGIAQAMADQWG